MHTTEQVNHDFRKLIAGIKAGYKYLVLDESKARYFIITGGRG